MSSRTNDPWQKRIRRLFFFVGTASTVWFVSSYIFERMKETRIKAIKEKKQKDLMRNHFTSLISTISYTLYALLPTIQPQLFDEYNVEEISQALQGLSSTSVSNPEENGSNLSESTNSLNPNLDNATETTAGNSLLLSDAVPHIDTHHGGSQHQQNAEPGTRAEGSPIAQSEQSESHTPEITYSSVLQNDSGASTSESWASEFQRRRESTSNSDETESEGNLGSSIGHIDTEDAMSSVVSQSISLPPTDTSSPSPPSDLSRSEQLHPSPPRSEPKQNKYHGMSKKELWKELKLQSLTRTITTIYLLPMLYILTSSQLSILARSKYMKDIQASLEPSPIPSEDDHASEGTRTPRNVGPSQTQTRKRAGWFSSFSTESMGLSEYKDSSSSSSSIIPNPLSILPTSITSYLPSFIAPSPNSTANHQPSAATIESEDLLAWKKQEEEELKAEAEKLFLTYSWWFLNKGWRLISERVEESVQKIFGNMPLKKEFTIEDWELKLKEVRAEIEMELSTNSTIELYDFTSHILPNPSISSKDIDIPYPKSPLDHSIYLKELYDQSKEQISSSDGRYLIEKGISTLLGNLINSLKNQLYNNPSYDFNDTKRLVDCLPEINKWGKDLWEGIPDSGVEALLAVPEYESFSALIFGDWSPRSS
ncbi:uncharacterized protein L201_002893 [Kwoniella dendrophila CBS 6074]|uniref:Peroxin-3 n=1 Tax=Kwoniella dendrophila CBS 6074 TaxID=1295534 RepID=A0AAX4JRC5_9TREE